MTRKWRLRVANVERDDDPLGIHRPRDTTMPEPANDGFGPMATSIYTPDQIGQARRIAKELNTTPGQVIGNPLLMARGTERPTLDAAPPRTRAWLSKPENFAVAHDDVEHLSRAERMFDDFAPFVPEGIRRAAGRGVFSYMRGVRNTRDTLGSAVADPAGAVSSYRAGMLNTERGDLFADVSRETRTGENVFAPSDYRRLLAIGPERDALRERGLKNPVARDVFEAAHSSIAGMGARVGGPFISAYDIWRGQADDTSTMFAQVRNRARTNIESGRGTLDDYVDLALGEWMGLTAAATPLIGEVGSWFSGTKTGFIAPSAASADFSYRLESGNAFEQYVNEGINPKLAAEMAHAAGVANSMIEQFGGMAMGSPIRSVSREATQSMTRRAVAARFGKEVVKGAIFEGAIEEGAQSLVTSFFEAKGRELNRAVYGDDIGPLDWNKAFGDAGYEAFIGLFIGGGMGAAFGAPGLYSDLRKADHIAASLRTVERLSEVARQSKLAKRDPEAFADSVDASLGQGEILVNMDGLQKMAADENMNFDELTQALGLDPDLVASARASGFLTMTPGDYAAKIGRTSFGPKVARHITTDPETNTAAQNEIVRAEAEKRIAEIHAGMVEGAEDLERIREEVKKTEKQMPAEDAETLAVIEGIEKQLNALEPGRRFGKEMNTQFAKVFAGIKALQAMSAKNPEDRKSVAEIWSQHRTEIISDLTDTRGRKHDWNRSALRFPKAEEIAERRAFVANEYAEIADDNAHADADPVDALGHALAAKALGKEGVDTRISQFDVLSKSQKKAAESRANRLIREAETRAMRPGAMPSEAATERSMQQAKALGYDGADRGEAAEWISAYRKYGPEGMTTAARLARAERMGFTVKAYHATDKDIFKFKRKLNDIGIHFGTAGQAQDRIDYLSTRQRAQRDPNSAVMYPVRLRLKNPLRTDDMGAWNDDNLEYGLERAGISKEAMRAATRGIRNSAGAVKALQDLLIRLGYDGIVYKNTGEVEGAQELQLQVDAARRAMTEGQRARGKPLNAYDQSDQQTPEYIALKEIEQKANTFREVKAKDSYIVFSNNQVRAETAAFNEDYDGPNLMGQMIGVMSGLTDKEAADLNTAQQMFRDGRSADDIWEATGWNKFGPKADDWQMELDASQMTMRTAHLQEILKGKNVVDDLPLETVIDFPALFEKYPQLRDVRVKFSRDANRNGAGVFDLYGMSFRDDKGGLRMRSVIQINFSTRAKNNIDEVLRSTMLHEVQHAIQVIEGWSRGANPADARIKNVPLFQELLLKFSRSMHVEEMKKHEEVLRTGIATWVAEYPNEGWNVVKEDDDGKPMIKILSEEDIQRHLRSYEKTLLWVARVAGRRAANLTYMHNRGEVQARMVQERANFTAEERARITPTTSALNESDLNWTQIWDGPRWRPTTIAMGRARASVPLSISPPTADDADATLVEFPVEPAPPAAPVDLDAVPTIPVGENTMGQRIMDFAADMAALELTDKDIILAYTEAVERGERSPNVSAAVDLDLNSFGFSAYLNTLRTTIRARIRTGVPVETLQADYGVSADILETLLSVRPVGRQRYAGGVDATMGQPGRPQEPAQRRRPDERTIAIERENAAVLAHAIREAGACASGAAAGGPVMAAVANLMAGNALAAGAALPLGLAFLRPLKADNAMRTGNMEELSEMASPQEVLRRMRDEWQKLPPDEVRFPTFTPEDDGYPNTLMPVSSWSGGARAARSSDPRLDRMDAPRDLGDEGSPGFDRKPSGNPLPVPADAPLEMPPEE